MRLSKILTLAGVALVVLGAGAALGWAVGSKSSGGKEPVVREPLAQSKRPHGVKGKTLGLTRVIVRPGAELALHHHPGTQIAYVEKGTLTYSVDTGSVVVRRGPADDHPRLVRKIKAGETAKLKKRQWVVEQPETHHHAANRGSERVVLYLATLFRTGAPPSIPG